jgi:sugar lactone lactonase YvrE
MIGAGDALFSWLLERIPQKLTGFRDRGTGAMISDRDLGFDDLELVLDAHARTGESPTWSQHEHVLYWIDIEEPALHRFDPKSGEDLSWEMPSQIGAFTLCKSGRVIAALRTGLVRLALDAGALEPLALPPYNPLTHRFNEGKCDARGRFWVATMHDPLRSPAEETKTPARPIHVFTETEGLRERPATAIIGNGIAWGPANDVMLFADTAAQEIQQFDFDLQTGSISGPRAFASFRDEQGRPDGAAVDSEGFYWSALYGGSRIVRLAPDGKIEREIRLPVSQPTMCAFGDADFGALYITTAARGLAPGSEPHAGGVFRCRPGVTGSPPFLFADESRP